jgi:hypothetical protein
MQLDMNDILSFVFPNSTGFEKVRTGIALDARGAKLTIVGQVPCRCRCHELKVVIQYVMKGRGNEDLLRLNLVEQMIRGSCPRYLAAATSAALQMTTLLVNDHLNKQDTCKGVTSGEAA